MKYAFYDLDSTAFENLVIRICRKLLGSGVQNFSTGPDGGRDARFEGTANTYPSSSNPFSGKFIIQAKHTNNPVGKFADSEFSNFTSQSSVLVEEIPRIKKLNDNRELDFYLLFSNRRLSAESEPEIREEIKKQTGVNEIHFFGLERIEMDLLDYPELTSNLDIIYMPLMIDPHDLAKVITTFHDNKVIISESTNTNFSAIPIAEKNKINNLTKEYFKIIESKSYMHFKDIKTFLEDPRNLTLKTYYENTVADLQDQIIANKHNYQNLDQILVNIFTMMTQRDGEIRSHKRLARVFLHYMYCNCDIGEQEYAETH